MDPALTAAAIGVGGTVIVGLAGFWASVRNTGKTTELARRAIELTEQRQLADRYSKAVEQLGSKELDVRIGGIYALERIAGDSPRDHPTIMEVLAAFIREHSQEQRPLAKKGAEPPERAMRPDVQAAATVIGRRTTRNDSQPINLEDADLSRADLSGADLSGAMLGGANLTSADLGSAILSRANLYRADLTSAYLGGANLTSAKIVRAILSGAILSRANLYRADLSGAMLGGANLTSANFTSAYLGGAILSRANLDRADLTRADLTGVDLTGANLGGAYLARADLSGVDLTSADLTGAIWPLSAVVPEGWQRVTDSGRLEPSEPDLGDTAAEQA